MRGHDTRDRSEGLDAFDPLSDIFFSAIAVVFVALIAVAPMIAHARPTPTSSGDPHARDHILFQGRELPLLLATATGISLTDPIGNVTVIPLDQIQDDPRLKTALQTIVATPDARLLVMIDPDASEAAFLLDPILVAARITSVVQVRLARACGDGLRTGELQSCLAETLEPASP